MNISLGETLLALIVAWSLGLGLGHWVGSTADCGCSTPTQVTP